MHQLWIRMCWKAEHFVSATIKYSLATYTTLHFTERGSVAGGREEAGWFWLLWSAKIHFTAITFSFDHNPLWVLHRAAASESDSWKKGLFWLFQIIFILASCLFSGKHLKVSVQMRSHLQTQKFHVIAKFQGEWQIYYRASISQEIWFKIL